MRRAANLGILAASLGAGLPFARDGYGWVALACGLAGVLWLLQSKYIAHRVQLLCLLMLVGTVGAGAFLSYNPLWQLTSLVLVLVAWDLDRTERDIQLFSMGGASDKELPALFRAHVKRLGIVIVAGWSLGAIALRVQISLNLVGALILGALALLSLRPVMQYISRARNRDEV